MSAAKAVDESIEAAPAASINFTLRIGAIPFSRPAIGLSKTQKLTPDKYQRILKRPLSLILKVVNSLRGTFCHSLRGAYSVDAGKEVMVSKGAAVTV
jgi:hypothetical protein